MKPGELSQYSSIVDGHVHFPHPDYCTRYLNILDYCGITRINTVCVPHPSRLSTVPDALYLKAHAPDRIYVSGGLDFSVFHSEPECFGAIFAEEVDRLLAMGCDGIKMWEGKPDNRKKYHIPAFDSLIYAPYWERLEERQVPVLIHLNDPEELWDREKLPDFAIREGWFYGDGTYVDYETQCQEMFNVMDRHPSLVVIFAHFLFFSAQLNRLAEWFDRFPNLYVDLAPGSEMYRNFSKDPALARDLFLRYQERIIYGTDFGAGALLADLRINTEPDVIRLNIALPETINLFSFVQTFLETDGGYSLTNEDGTSFWNLNFPYYGICLPADVLVKIYKDNFDRIYGLRPKPIQTAAVIAECDRLIARINSPGNLLLTVKDDSVARMVKTHFEQSG